MNLTPKEQFRIHESESHKWFSENRDNKAFRAAVTFAQAQMLRQHGTASADMMKGANEFSDILYAMGDDKVSAVEFPSKDLKSLSIEELKQAAQAPK